MGCGASGAKETETKTKSNPEGNYTVGTEAGTKNVANGGGNNNTSKAASPTNRPDEPPKAGTGKVPAPTPNNDGESGDALPYREKNVSAPLLREIEQEGRTFLISHYAPKPGLRGVIFSCKDVKANVVHSISFTDAAFHAFKDKHIHQLGWNLFWRALFGSFTKEDGIRVHDDGAKLELFLKTNKEPKPYQVFLQLDLLPQQRPELTFIHFIEPFIIAYEKRKERRLEGDDSKEKKEKYLREDDAEIKEAKINTYECVISETALLTQQRSGSLTKLKEKVAENQSELQSTQAKVDKVVRSIRSHKEGHGMHPLDGLYSVGGARPFQHSEFAAQHHVPKELEPNQIWLRLMEDGRIKEATPTDTSCLTKRPTDPEVEELVDSLTDDKVWQLIECFEALDKWNYDCFLIDEITEGRTLFYTCYAIFLKYGFIQHFNMNRDTVFNFLRAVQAGYCPNKYHNSMHAADVLQIIHYAMGPGGMRAKLRLSHEDMFAAVITASIHDYNHPGLNNNFHTKVSAYLGTLYNDRSILENHHCACVFEIMLHKKYDIFASLTEEQKKDIRDTITEMLLSTDMGNHAKIFSAFKRRMADAPDWGKKKEDVRLSLVMAIKLADISNCSRPTELYLKWANRIAEEFYLQGEAEARMGLPISPFMDRRKHDTDFHKGQVSFMNYIVCPLFDSISEVFPDMRFTLDLCSQNRDYWLK